MSMSVAKRREACLHLLRNDFDIDATVDWVLREFADEPSMERAKNKGKLARNIVTIGGSGDQQSLNLVAFEQALAIYGEEKRRKSVSALEGENKALKEALERERDRNEELGKDFRDQINKVSELQDKLGDARVEVVKLAAGVDATPAQV